jgi:hypothetical protein
VIAIYFKYGATDAPGLRGECCNVLGHRRQHRRQLNREQAISQRHCFPHDMEKRQVKCQICGVVNFLIFSRYFRQPLALSKLSTSIRRLADSLRGPIGGSQALATAAQCKPAIRSVTAAAGLRFVVRGGVILRAHALSELER